MPDYLVRYEKTGNAKYISHLDFLRTFNRVLRRSKVGIAYSQGFNPHPLLSFALPLSVGVTSECEMLEMTLEKERPNEEIVKMLNDAMPDGIRVLDAHPSPGKLAKKIRYAIYQVKAVPMPDAKQIESFMALSEVIMDKKTKSGIKECDIREDIISVEWTPDALIMKLSAGSQANLKPDLVLHAIEKYTGFTADDFWCHRTHILDHEGNVME